MLRLVEGAVGGAHESLHLGPLGQGDPDRHRDPDDSTVREPQRCVAGDGVPDTIGDGQRLGRGRAREQDAELLAPVPVDHVLGPDVQGEDAGHGLEELIPRRVSVGVVDRLEVVDVDHRERDRSSGPEPALERPREVVVQTSTVREPGQVVDVRQLPGGVVLGGAHERGAEVRAEQDDPILLGLGEGLVRAADGGEHADHDPAVHDGHVELRGGADHTERCAAFDDRSDQGERGHHPHVAGASGDDGEIPAGQEDRAACAGELARLLGDEQPDPGDAGRLGEALQEVHDVAELRRRGQRPLTVAAGPGRNDDHEEADEQRSASGEADRRVARADDEERQRARADHRCGGRRRPPSPCMAHHRGIGR